MNKTLLALLGAVVGGMLGYFLFSWILTQGFYGLILPGGCLGLGASLVSQKSKLVPVVCAVAALGVGVFAEWKHFPFIADGSFGFFVTHLHQLKTVKLLMLVAGNVSGFLVTLADGFSETS